MRRERAATTCGGHYVVTLAKAGQLQERGEGQGADAVDTATPAA